MTESRIPGRAIVLVFVLTLVWGTNWPLFPLAVAEVSVWTFRAFAVAIAGGTLLAIARARGQSLAIPRRFWLPLTAAAICYLAFWNIATAYAAILIPSGQAAVLGFTMPLWAALLSWIVLGERPVPRVMLAVALGVVAVVLLWIPRASTSGLAPVGFALGIASGFGWAVGTLILKRARVPVSATVVTGWQLLIAAVPTTIGAFAFGEGPWFMPSWQSLAVIAWIALVPMSIGNVSWFAIVGLLPANVAGLSAILVPVVAMVSGAIVHGEPLGALEISAMLCCAAALSLALLRPAETPRVPASPANAAVAPVAGTAPTRDA